MSKAEFLSCHYYATYGFLELINLIDFMSGKKNPQLFIRTFSEKI